MNKQGSIQYLLQEMEDMLKLRNYSPKTIKSYVGSVAEYLRAKQNNLDLIDIDFTNLLFLLNFLI
ncbi:MAG: hypothetical protein V1815_01085 [Candidatus Woesearchaeota archaeon]